MQYMKKIAQNIIESGTPVWMGCDVGKQFDRKLGVWDLSLLQQEQVYGFGYEIRDKATRLEYHQTLMTHAMLFTGVDVDPSTCLY
tara:strand:- start:65 stop:319 length:255 start_codon:yes stop_codon:yes gene_type:complete